MHLYAFLRIFTTFKNRLSDAAFLHQKGEAIGGSDSKKGTMMFMLFRLIGWLSRIDKDAKEARDKRIFDLWLACYTEQEIADDVGIHQTVVGDVLRESGDLPKTLKPQAEHLTNFEPPIYNFPFLPLYKCLWLTTI